MKVSAIAIPGLASAASGVIGWLLHAGTIDGTTLGSTVGLSSATLVAGIALLSQVRAAWKQAGGVLDGKLTPAEFAAITDTITGKLAPELKPLTNAAMPVLLPVANELLTHVTPQATALIDQLSQWFTDDAVDHNESVLNAKMLDILSHAVAHDDEGTKAAATLRARLHDSMFRPKTAPMKVHLP